MSDILCTPELLSFRHLKDLYGIPRTSAYRWMNELGFPKPIQLGPNSVRFKRTEIDAWVAERPTAAIHGGQEDVA